MKAFELLNQQCLAIICGGRSLEHEVSLTSAKWVIEAAQTLSLSFELFWLNKQNQWFRIIDVESFLQNPQSINQITKQSITPIFGNDHYNWQTLTAEHQGKVDMIFPVMHGLDSEDGAIQGLCQFWNVPFIGPNIRDAVITYDKRIAKDLLRHHHIAVTPFVTLLKGDYDGEFTLPDTFIFPVFVKAANGGSSIGVYKAHNAQQLTQAIDKVFSMDHTCLIEQAIEGKEIEVAVLIDDDIKTTTPGELEVYTDFYDYKAKYLDKDASKPMPVAQLPTKTKQQIQQTAEQVCKILGCEGMARVDFFVDADNQFVVNEINSIPGLTPISLFPQLWQQAGVNAEDLLQQLMLAAYNRFQVSQQRLTQLQTMMQWELAND